MNNKGFTLVEILAVITIISMLVVIAIPASQGVAKKINEKMYESKLDVAKQSAKLWTLDNIKCFKNADFEKSDITSRSEDCQSQNIVYNSSEGEIKLYTMQLSWLADEGYYDYDDEVNKKIIDPRNKNNNLNDKKLLIKYDTTTKKITSINIENP